MKYFLDAFRKWNDFKGRATQKEFWVFFGIDFTITLIVKVFQQSYIDHGSPSDLFSLLLIIPISMYVLIAFIPRISITIRRLHDTGKSGLWLLLLFIPFLGWLALLVFLLMPSQNEENKWGRECLDSENKNLEVHIKKDKIKESEHNYKSFDENTEKVDIKSLEKIANEGDVKAQYDLGECYYKGIGVDISYEKAIKWWRKSAVQGNVDAQYNIGLCYYKGEGVDKNTTIAKYWLEKACSNDKKEACKLLENLSLKKKII